jgi:hypothetical protein
VVIANQLLALIAFLILAYIYLVGLIQTPRVDLFVIFPLFSSLTVFGLWLIYACVRMFRYQTQDECLQFSLELTNLLPGDHGEKKPLRAEGEERKAR